MRNNDISMNRTYSSTALGYFSCSKINFDFMKCHIEQTKQTLYRSKGTVLKSLADSLIDQSIAKFHCRVQLQESD